MFYTNLTNKDDFKKPKVDSYYRFYAPIKFNDNDLFSVRIVCEKNKDQYNLDISNLYDVIIEEKNRDRILTSRTSMTSSNPISTYRIAQKTSLVNGKETLKIKDMLSGVLDMDRNLYLV